MQTTTTVRLFCPINLDLDTIDERHRDDIVYLCHLLHMKYVLDPRYADGYSDYYVRLHRDKMRAVLGKGRWESVRQIALDLGLIERKTKNETLTYRSGHYAMAYRLATRYRNSSFRKVEVKRTWLVKNLRKWRKSERRKVWLMIRDGERRISLTVALHLWKMLRKTKIERRDIVEDLDTWGAAAVEKLDMGDWRFEVDDYGRLHTNISNLWRQMRKYLRVDGQPLVNVDISNSQPLFLGLLVKKKVGEEGRKGEREREEKEKKEKRDICGYFCRETEIPISTFPSSYPPDLVTYLSLCQQGKLYAYVNERMPCPVDFTDEEAYMGFKKAFLAVLYAPEWFSRDSVREGIHSVLWAHFPTLAAFVEDEKTSHKDLSWKDRHKALARQAQIQESDFVYNRVVPAIMKKYPDLYITTVHDSVMTTVGNEDKIRRIMLSEFARLGVRPNIKIERFSNEIVTA